MRVQDDLQRILVTLLAIQGGETSRFNKREQCAGHPSFLHSRYHIRNDLASRLLKAQVEYTDGRGGRGRVESGKGVGTFE